MPEHHERLIALYQKQAKDYDQSGIQGLEPWRREAVKRLHLKHGDLVDLGCGTGLNFPWLQEAVGPQGRIIGVDLTDAMFEQARRRIAEAGWKNVELAQADATSYPRDAQRVCLRSRTGVRTFLMALRLPQAVEPLLTPQPMTLFMALS